MGAMVSSSHTVSAAPSSSGVGLTLFLHFTAGDSLYCPPQETVLRELVQCEFFPWAAVLHSLLQRGSLPGTAWVQSFRNRLPQGESPAGSQGQKTCSSGGSSLHRSMGVWSSMSFPQAHKQKASSCSGMGSCG